MKIFLRQKTGNVFLLAIVVPSQRASAGRRQTFRLPDAKIRPLNKKDTQPDRRQAAQNFRKNSQSRRRRHGRLAETQHFLLLQFHQIDDQDNINDNNQAAPVQLAANCNET